MQRLSESPAMWDDVPRLALVHAVLRRTMLAQGARDQWFDAPHGVRAHAYLAGPEERAPVLLVHGLGDSAHTWFRTVPFLVAAGHRVVAIDLYGHGRTPLPRGREWMRVLEQADLVGRAAAEFGGGKGWALVGHSLGGWVAAKLASRRPDGLRRLSLVASAGLSYEGMEKEVDLLRVENAKDVRRLWSAACHRVPWELRLLNADVAKLFTKPVVRAFTDADQSIDLLTEAEARRIEVPTSIIWGEDDGLVLPLVGERLALMVPDARLAWIPACGHAPQVESPREYHRLLAESLTGFGDGEP